MKRAFKIKRLISSFGYAFNGFIKVVRNEPNMVVHLTVTFLVILFGFLFKVSCLEWIFLTFAIGLVIGAEVLNTSIENLVDLVTDNYNKKAEIVKDTAAAFVMLLSVIAAIVGLIIFIPKFIAVIGG